MTELSKQSDDKCKGNHSGGLLRRIGLFCFIRFRLTFVLTVLLIGLSVLSSQRFLHLDTDWLILFSDERPEIASLRYWRQNLPGSKDMAVIISGDRLQDRQAAALELGEAFRESPDLLESPLDAIDTELFVRSGLYFLSADQLSQLEEDSERVIKGTQILDLNRDYQLSEITSILSQSAEGSQLLAKGLEAFVRATDFNGDESAGKLIPVLQAESAQVQRSLGDFQAIPERAFLSLDGGKTLIVLVRPKIGNQALEKAAPAVAQVRKDVEEMRQRFPSLSLLVTGEPVLVVDERRTIAQDSIRGTFCSLILVMVLFRFGFREFLRPCLALSSLLVGLTWTLGVISTTIGHLNFITITYVPILVGIGLDFGIHMAFRYYEHRKCLEPNQAIQMALDGAGTDTLFGALTTSASFAVLTIIGFRGVAELGAIALVGVLLCQLSAITFLPAILAWLEHRGNQLPDKGLQELTSIERRICGLDRAILTATLLFSVFCAFWAPGVRFNIHLLKMQNPDLESVQTELRLVAEGKSSVLTALIAVPDIESARRLEADLRELPTVAEVISLAAFVPQVDDAKNASVVNLLSRQQKLLELLEFLKKIPEADANQAQAMMRDFETLSLDKEEKEKTQALLKELHLHLKERGPGPIMDALESLRQDTMEKLDSLAPILKKQGSNALVAESLPQELKGRLLRTDGQYVIKVFPKVDIWQEANLNRFLEQLRQVSPQVSGEPVLIELFSRLVLQTHWQGIALSLVFMLAVLIGILRNLEEVFFALAPTALSLVLMMGTMSFLQWDFNPANFVAVPMLLGIGSVFGLHAVLRMRELGHEKLLTCSTGPAICLSAATSMAGFASLGLADHRGIASLGILVTLGLFFNAFLSILVLPAWLRFNGKS